MSTNLESLYAQKIADLSDVEFSFFQGVVRLLLCQRINLGLSDFRIALKYNVQTARSVGGLGSDPFTNDLERTFNDFVIHDTNTDSWIFVDLSVRSYLENHKDYHPRINHAFVATCCLQYLSSDEVIDSKRPSGEAQAQASHTFLSLFHQYACLYWPLHLSKSEELRSQRPLKELCDKFMLEEGTSTSSSPAFKRWSEDAEHGVYGGSDLLADWSERYGSEVWDTIGQPANYIFVAVAWGFDDIVKSRLDRDPDGVKARSHEFNSPLLCIAASRGRLSTAQILVDRGADVQTVDGFGESPLMIASRANDLGMARLLLDSGAPVDQMQGGRRSYGLTPLHEAVREGCCFMVQLLLEHHPDIGIQDTEGMTALDTAVEEGFPEIVRFLLEDMVSLQHLQKEICVLAAQAQQAVKNKDTDHLQALLEQWPTGYGNSDLDQILWKSVQPGNEALTELLLRKGGNPNAMHHGFSVLYTASTNYVQDDDKNDFPMLELLLRYGANPNARCTYGSKLALCYACKQGHLGLVRFLVEAGADVNLAADDDSTPLYEAVCSDEEEIVKLLLECGACPNYIGHPRLRGRKNDTPEECTLLDIAIEEGAEGIAGLLRQHGAITKRTTHATDAV